MSSDASRTEHDRMKKGSLFSQLRRRPEVGSFLVMLIVIVAIGFASNGNAFNPLGLKNNLTIIAQFGIIATGACLLMIAGDFDLSIGSMIGFAGMSIAMMLKWGTPVRIGRSLSCFCIFCHISIYTFYWLDYWNYCG